MPYSTGTYTQRMLDLLETTAELAYEEDIDYSSLRDIINSDDFFRPFSARLLSFYNAKTGSSFSADDTAAATDLYNRLQKKNIDISRNTVKNWFAGETDPKLDDMGREAMFKVAFALELTVEETEKFFHKVFLDKAFNLRNAKELICKYCLLNSRSYADAQALNSLVTKDSGSEESQNETRILNTAADTAASDSELITFINSHPADFFADSSSAKKKQAMLLSELCGEDGRPGLVEREYYSSPEHDGVGTGHRNLRSVDFMLDSLLFSGASSRALRSDIVSVREVFTRKEVINQFPNKDTLSKDSVSSYIRRKNLILLYFYKFWCSDKLDNRGGTYNDFIDELNDSLSECGFSPLYSGNPYDWLFMFCSACKDSELNPLDVLRDIIDSE